MNVGQSRIVIVGDHFRIAFITAGRQNDSLGINRIFTVGVFDLYAVNPSVFICCQIDSRTVVADFNTVFLGLFF